MRRAVTNFRFVDDKGQDVSVATGHYGRNQPTWLLGAVASANRKYCSGQRIMAGWWNTDEITEARAPVEIVWMKVQIDRISWRIMRWFREG